MASKLDTIIAEQTAQGKLLATLIANQTNHHERIFGKDNQKGALQFLQDEIKVVDGKIELEITNRTTAVAGVAKTTGEIKSKLTLWTGMAVGAGSVVGWAVKVVSPKLAQLFHP